MSFRPFLLRHAGRATLFFGILFTGSRPAAAAEPVILEAGPDWDLLLSGQVRPRLLLHSGRNFLGSQSEWREWVTQRARFGAEFEHVSGLSVFIQLQDVRAWGEEDSTLDTSAAGFDVHQAYGTLPIVNDLFLSVGRQELVFGNERLVGNLDWFQQARSFDGARLSFRPTGGLYSIDAFYAKISETGQPPEGNVPSFRLGDIDFGGVHASFQPVAAHEVAPVYLVDSDQSIDLLRHTVGISADGDTAGFSYGGEFYYQLGSIQDETIRAYLGALRAGYTLDVPVQPSLVVFAEWLSGDGSFESAFDTLFGSNHEFYGELDFFFTPEDTNYLGLIDIGGRIGTGIVEGLRTHADVHYFRTSSPTPTGERELGLELDFRVDYSPMDYVEISALYGVLFPGDAFRDLRDYEPSTPLSAESLAYLTLDVRF